MRLVPFKKKYRFEITVILNLSTFYPCHFLLVSFVRAKNERNKIPLKPHKNTFQTEIERSDRTSIIFTLKNEVGGLAKALQVFQELGINVLHLELRPSQFHSAQGDVLVDIDCDAKNLDQVLKMLRREVKSVNYAQMQLNSEEFPPPTPVSGSFGEKSSTSTRDICVTQINYYRFR